MNKPISESTHDFKKGPYLHKFPNRRQRRKKLTREINNSKSTKLVVTQIGPYMFAKTYKWIDFRGEVQYTIKASGLQRAA